MHALAALPDVTTPQIERVAPALGLTRRRLRLSAGVITYVDEGAGRPVVLLHGAPATSLGFVRVIRGLSGYCRVLAPDLPGFGQSEPGDAFDGSLNAHAAAVEEFCLALDLRNVVFYVNDSSGAFGLAAAARLHHHVAGLVVADTVPIPLTGRAWPVKLVLRHVLPSRFVRAANRRWNLLPWLVATVAPWRRPFTPSERAELVAQFDTSRKRDRILDLFAHMGWDDAFMRDTATQIVSVLSRTPTLILYGQLDPMRLVGGVGRYQRLLPHHKVVIVPWEEHFPILAEGAQVADVLRSWLDTLR